MATRYVTRNSIEEVSFYTTAEILTGKEIAVGLLTKSNQYVRWIQEDKLRLIARSLNSDDVWQKDVDNERWKVISTIHKHD